MATIFFYMSILLLSTFFIYISEKGKGALEYNVFRTIGLLIIFIPAALRYDIGTDYLSYVRIYKHIQYNIAYNEYLEPAYYLINHTLNQLGANPQWIFVVTSFIFSFCLFKSYPKRNAWILHFVAMSLFWLSSLNLVRQGIAVAITLIALSSFVQSRYKRFFILTLLASTFHYSALIITAIGTLSFIRIRYSLKITVIPIVFVVLIVSANVFIFIITEYIYQILGFVGAEKYISYFDSRYFTENTGGTGLGALILAGFSTYTILQSKDLLETNKNYWLLILLNFSYAMSTVLASNILIFTRMQAAFVIAPVFTTYILYDRLKHKKLNKLAIALFVLYIFLSFLKLSVGAITPFHNPKLNPYQSILSNSHY